MRYEILKSIFGLTVALRRLAVASGSFVVGAICGVIVIYEILKAQDK